MLQKSIQRIQLMAALLAAVTFSAAVMAAEQEAIATVNGVAVPKSRFELLLKSQTQQGEQDTPAFREELRDIMITREVLVQEARRRDMHESEEFKAQLDAMKQQLLISMLFNKLIQELEPSDEAMRAEYDRVRGETEKLGDKEYLVRHILVNEKADADAIIEELAAGGDFSEIAKEKSTDTGSREQGGELGWSEPQRYVQPFADALVALDKGETTDAPVKTDFGYHVIELLDTRAMPFPEYEEVKEQVRKEMLTRARDDLITRLRNEAEIDKIGSLDSGQ